MSLLLIVSLFGAEARPPQQRVDFSATSVEGERKLPTGTYVLGVKRPDFGNLISIRQNFDDKIVKSVDGL